MEKELDGKTYRALYDAWANADYGIDPYRDLIGGKYVIVDEGDEENGGLMVGGNLVETLQRFGRGGAGMPAAMAEEMAARLIDLGLISVRPFDRTMNSGRRITELYTITRDGQIALRMKVD